MEAPEVVDVQVKLPKVNNIFSLSEDQIKQLAKYFAKEQIAWCNFNRNNLAPYSRITPTLLEFIHMVFEAKQALDIHIDNAGKLHVIRINLKDIAKLLHLLPQHGKRHARIFDYQLLAKSIADNHDAKQLMDLACFIILHEAEKDIANRDFQYTACTLFQEDTANIAFLTQLSHLENNHFIVKAYKKRAKGDTDIEKAQHFLAYIAKKKRKHKLPKISAFIFRVLYERLTSYGLYRESVDPKTTYFPEAGELKVGTLYNQRFISGALISTYQARAHDKRNSRNVKKYIAELNQVKNFTIAFTHLLNESAEWKALCKAICFDTPLNQSVTEALEALKKTKGEFTAPPIIMRNKITSDLQQTLMATEEEEPVSSEITTEEGSELSRISSSSQNDWQEYLSDLDDEEEPFAPPLIPPQLSATTNAQLSLSPSTSLLATRNCLSTSELPTFAWRNNIYSVIQSAREDISIKRYTYLCVALYFSFSLTIKFIMLAPFLAPLSDKIAECLARALYTMHMGTSVTEMIPAAIILAAMSPEIITFITAVSYSAYRNMQSNELEQNTGLPLIHTVQAENDTLPKQSEIKTNACWNSFTNFFKAERDPIFQYDPSVAVSNPIFDLPVDVERIPLLGKNR